MKNSERPDNQPSYSRRWLLRASQATVAALSAVPHARQRTGRPRRCGPEWARTPVARSRKACYEAQRSVG